MYLEKGHRVEAAVITFVDRTGQMLVTLVMGLLGAAYLWIKHPGPIARGLLIIEQVEEGGPLWLETRVNPWFYVIIAGFIISATLIIHW